MRIRCPACSSTYDVPDTLLATPRTVRCARCAHDWMAEPIVEGEPPAEPEPSPAEAASEPVPRAFDILAARAVPAEPSEPPEPPARRRDPWLTAAWAASFAALAGLGVAGLTQRDLIMRQWPASKLVYAKVGLVSAQPDAPPR